MRLTIQDVIFRNGGGFFRVVLCAAAFALPMGDSFGGELIAEPADTPPVILFIGDSHTVGSFGKKEDSLLREVPGFRVATYAICGSSPHHWFLGIKTKCGYFFRDTNGMEQRGVAAETPLITDLLTTHQPRYTVVALGTNMLGAPLDWVEETSGEMAQAIVKSGSKCIWIGPPQGRNEAEAKLGRIYDALGAAVSQHCLLIDSRKYTTYPEIGGDGIHFDSFGKTGQSIAAGWALATFDVLRPKLKITKPIRSAKTR